VLTNAKVSMTKALQHIYELLLAIEVRAVLHDGPPIYGVILHLTGSKQNPPLLLTRSARKPGVLVEPIEVWLAEQSAEESLTLISLDQLPLCVLPWIVLMKGGGDPKLIERWKLQVERVPDVERRSRFRDFALVFAELIPELVDWQRLLEGWQVRESRYLTSFETRGEVKRARADLIKGLGFKLKSAVPEPIRLAIEGTNDLNTLDRWYQTLFTVESFDDFLAKMKAE
jgi:hypothetical protein